MVDYKLRLGDGTTFSVDEKGLTTWLQGGLVDDKARVQPAGSKKWFSLKQVLAAQGAQRGHAERQTEKGRADVDRQAAEETAEIERKVAGQRAAEERKAGEDLGAAERKAAEDRTAAERKLVEERAAAERRAAEDRAAAEARAAAERSAAEAREAAGVAEAERLVAAERAERAERKRKAEEARLEAEQQAAEDVRVAAERKAAEERAAERKAAEDRAAAARRETEVREAAAREAERVAEAERLVAAERAERAERKRRADEERLGAQRRAAEEGAARERDTAIDAFHVSDLAEPPATEIAIEPAATMVKVEDFERELGLLPVTFADGTGAPSGRESPALRIDRATPAPILDRSESMPSAGGGEAPSAVVKPPTAVDNAVMRLLKVLDRGVIWVVRSFVPLAGDAIARSVRSLKSAGPKLTNAVPKLKGAVPKLKGLLARRAKPAEPAPAGLPPAAASAVAPAPWSAPAPSPVPPAVREPPRKPAVPPPSSQKVEVIPFAAAEAKPKVEDDVWDGEDVWEEPSGVSTMFAVLWLWVKRVTIATALIVTAALLYLNKEKWLPQAKSAAIVLGQHVDELSERASTRTVPPEAIEAARAQVPYLRPQTIELIMAQSTEGVLEPAQVFHRAHQAVERARPSLPPHIAAEIDHHTAAVVAELDPAEGEQLRGYLAALRAGTPTAAYQDKEAVWLMARGVRRLPAERLARMQELFAQAVTAALQPPA